MGDLDQIPSGWESLTGVELLERCSEGAATGMPKFSWMAGGVAVNGDEAGPAHYRFTSHHQYQINQ